MHTQLPSEASFVFAEVEGIINHDDLEAVYEEGLQFVSCHNLFEYYACGPF